MDLGIPQKSLRVRLKEEKEGKGHSFFHEQIERRRGREKRIFLSREGGRTTPWHAYRGSKISTNPYSKQQHEVQGKWHEFRGGENNI